MSFLSRILKVVGVDLFPSLSGRLDHVHYATYEELEAYFLHIPGIYNAGLDMSDSSISISFDPEMVDKVRLLALLDEFTSRHGYQISDLHWSDV